MAQQAAEKAIKTALVSAGTESPKTHDLDRLRSLLPDECGLAGEAADLSELSDWAVDARYPDEVPDPSWADARRAVRQAKAVIEPVSGYLAARGLSS